MTDKADIIRRVCEAWISDEQEKASTMARTEYPFLRLEKTGRAYSPAVCTRIFIRDGFLDRYSGTRLIFPGTLRFLSRIMPQEFPAHVNWKMTDTHAIFWELFPTIDHVLPVSRGGADEESNYVTTSMLRNSAKAHWTLDELGWQLIPPGNFAQWDGLMKWFVATIEHDKSLLAERYLANWFRAAKAELRQLNLSD